MKMETKKLYYVDSYIKEFEAEVISCVPAENGYDIVLDSTAFFPEAGGQSADRGYIEGSEVFDVRERGDEIHHFAKAPVAENTTVRCSLFFEERLDKMRCHTAEHIISGIFHRLYGIENTGFHLGHEDVTFDTSAPISREQLAEAERLANEAVMKNMKIETLFPTAEELRTMEYRSKLDLTDNVRIVVIGDADSCACCAPHVKYTGEIGLIKLVDAVKHKGGSRIRMLAGKRAYDYIAKITEENSSVSVMLSAPVTEISTEVGKLLDSKSALDMRIKDMGNKMAALLADSVKNTETNAVYYLPELDTDALRTFVNIAGQRVKGALVALTGADGDFKYIIHRDSPDLPDTVKRANSELLGKGGGRQPMAQGSFSASLERIKAFFES